jgi:DNA end-binding protein Ku
MLDLAVEIVKSKARHFQPDKFEDHYESALRELIAKKQRGEKIKKTRRRPQAQVINLMDALRRSAKADRARTQRASPREQRTRRGRSSARAARTGQMARRKQRPGGIKNEGERRQDTSRPNHCNVIVPVPDDGTYRRSSNVSIIQGHSQVPSFGRMMALTGLSGR